MASTKQWSEWREEYLSGLRSIIDDAPYEFAHSIVYDEYGNFDLEKAKRFVADTIQKEHIQVDLSESVCMTVYLCSTIFDAESSGTPASIKDALTRYEDFKKGYHDSNDLYCDVDYFRSCWYYTILKTCYYIFLNHPIAFKHNFERILDELNVGGMLNWKSCRLRQEDLFAFLCEMTSYGLNKMLTDISCPVNYFDDLFDAIRNVDYNEFKSICRNGNIDLTEIAEIAGYIQANYKAPIESMLKPIQSSEQETPADEKYEISQVKPLFSMLGVPDDVVKKIFSCDEWRDVISKYGQMRKVEEDDEEGIIFQAISLISLFPYIEYFLDDELVVINRCLDEPVFEPAIKIAQILFYDIHGRFPDKVKICFTPEEQEEIEAAGSQSCEPQKPKQSDDSKATSRQSNAGAPKKIWIQGWSEEKAKQKISQIHSSVAGELEDFSFGEKSEAGKEKAIKAAAAAIVVYCIHAIDLTKESNYNAAAKRILNAPRSSVNLYLRRLNDWYVTLLNHSSDYSNANEVIKQVIKKYDRWKKEDPTRASFILANFAELKRIINNCKWALGKEFGIETKLEYIPKKEKGDAVLGGSLGYNDDILNDNVDDQAK